MLGDVRDFIGTWLVFLGTWIATGEGVKQIVNAIHEAELEVIIEHETNAYGCGDPKCEREHPHVSQ